MNTRRIGILFSVLCLLEPSLVSANAVVAGRVIRVLRALGKPALAISTSAVAGVVSAKMMKDLEHVHDDSPTMHIVTYYALVDSRKMEDAKSCWEVPPESHFSFMKTIEKVVVWDIKEINRTPQNSAVFVTLSAKQYGREAEEWRGTIDLRWHDTHWLIKSMHISKRAA